MTTRTDGADLASLETALAGSGDDRLRRIALAALVARSIAKGWPEECRSRLKVYQRDASALVAAAAQFTFPAGGEEPGATLPAPG